METEFKYWCIESELDASLYGILAPLSLADNEKGIELRKYPNLDYAIEVAFRWRCLNEGLSSLQVLQKMLKVKDYPIIITNDAINRHEWFRITSDLILFRLAALRDYSFCLINSVFELNLSPLNIKLKKIGERLKDSKPKVIEVLEKIAKSGMRFRDDRNLLAHEGVFYGFEDEDLEIRKAVSINEARNKLKNIKATGFDNMEKTTDDNIIEFKEYYISRLDKLYVNFMAEGNLINEILNNLCDILADEFEKRYNQKTIISGETVS